MPVPRPLVAIERASGSVSEICWSGAACTCSPIHAAESLHLLLDAGDLLLQVRRLGLGQHSRSGRGRPVELRQVARDAVLELLHPRLQLALGVKFLSRLLTALNLLPSMATDAPR